MILPTFILLLIYKVNQYRYQDNNLFNEQKKINYYQYYTANFRPITLEPVPLKVFTSGLRNSTFQFLAENNYIEQNIQKGFTPKLSGTLEHTAQLAHIINKARVKQRSLIITLLDLKNAFGEVHHNLIYEVLEYHHIPDHISNLVSSVYTDFQTSLITEQFNTSFIAVGRGVLQSCRTFINMLVY